MTALSIGSCRTAVAVALISSTAYLMSAAPRCQGRLSQPGGPKQPSEGQRVALYDPRHSAQSPEATLDAERNDEVTPRKAEALHKLASSNFAKFAVQVQQASTEVQMKIIEQIPEFRKVAVEAVDSIAKAHDSTVSASQKSEDHVHLGAHEWRAALIAMLDEPTLTLEEKLRITAEIGETVKTQAAVHAENNKHRAALFGKVVLGGIAVAGLVVLAAAGGKLQIDGGDSA